jgi:tetraacyldisaccharide 4'-kinase
MISRLREWAYSKRLVKPIELPAFVLSVGNLSLGGTGKSAFVMLLAEWAASRRIPTLVLSRGYKRRNRALQIVGPGETLPDAADIGDEPWMIKNRVPALRLLVHANRARMALRHWQDLGEPRLVLLDDAFQHWRASRDLDVLMVDATESLEQRVIPFGRLRESVLAVRRADLVVITHSRSVTPVQLEALERRLRASSVPRLKPIWKRSTHSELRILKADYECSGFLDAASGKTVEIRKGRRIVIVSGIAKPDHLRAVAREAGLHPEEEIYFPDHHRLNEQDVRQVKQALRAKPDSALLVTEKDWGRWKSLFSEETPGYVIRVRFVFDGAGPAELERVLGEIAKGAECSTSR